MPTILPDWCCRARVAALIAICVALLLSERAVALQSNGLETVAVRPSFFMIAGAGSNVAVQVGEDGVVVVDPGSVTEAPNVLAAIKRISTKPIRYIINTGPDADHVGGNEALSKA